MGSFDITDFAPRTDGWWDPQVGDTVVGEVIYVDRYVKDDFDKKGKELNMRIDLRRDDGTSISVYAVPRTAVNPETLEPLEGCYCKRDAAAIFDAVRRAGRTSIDTGGRLAMQRLADVPSAKGGLPAREFYAEYEPPAANRMVIPPPAEATQPKVGMLGAQAPVQAPAPAPGPIAQVPAQVSATMDQVAQKAARLQALNAASEVPFDTLAVMTDDQLAGLEAALAAAQAPAPAPAPAAPAVDPTAALRGLLGNRG